MKMYFSSLAFSILGGFLLSASACAKVENVIPANSYARADVVATEVAFSLLNSSIMQTDGGYRNGATCSATAAPCLLASGVDYKQTFDWSACRFDHGQIAVMTGQWISYFQNDNTCMTPLANGKSMNRLTSDGVFSVVYRMPNGDKLELNTLQDTGFPGQSMGNNGVLVNQVNADERTFKFDAIQVVRTDEAGTSFYDVFANSVGANGSGLTTVVKNVPTMGDITVNGATYVYFREVQRIKVAFNSLVWNGESCCYPRSGQMTLEFANYNPAVPSAWPATGQTSIVTFSSTCGQATLMDAEGYQTAYNFTECF